MLSKYEKIYSQNKIWEKLKIWKLDKGRKYEGFPGGRVVKNLAANAGRHKIPGFYPWVEKIPWRRKYSSILALGKYETKCSGVSNCTM